MTGVFDQRNIRAIALNILIMPIMINISPLDIQMQRLKKRLACVRAREGIPQPKKVMMTGRLAYFT